jgi:hypothetical protein
MDTHLSTQPIINTVVLEATQIVLTVREDMIIEIMAELTELWNDSGFFRIPPAAKKLLTKHWRA